MRPGRDTRRLPPSPDPRAREWLVGRRPASFEVREPRLHRPHVLLLMHAGTRRLAGVNVVPPDFAAAAAADWVLEQLGPAPIGRRSFRTEDAALAAALRGRLGARTTVSVAGAPELETAFESLAAFVRKGGPALELNRDSASPDARRAFFRAAALLYEAAPWTVASDSEVLCLDAPELGQTGACVLILGAADEDAGLFLLRSMRDHETMVRASLPGDRTAHPPATLSIAFQDAGDLPVHVVDEARSRGWKLGPGLAVPVARATKAGGGGRRLDEDDYRLATGCLEAVARFYGRHPTVFDGRPEAPVAETFALDDLPGAATVTLTAPHPEAFWRWGEESAYAGLLERAVEKVLREFREAQGDLPPEALEPLLASVGELLRFVTRTFGGEPLGGWSDVLVEGYLLDEYPRKGGLTGAGLEAVPGHLDAFFAWLGETGREKKTVVRQVRACIARCRERFLLEARRPERFGPAKALMQAMEREGIDPSDQAAVDHFLVDFNRRLQDDPSLLPLPPALEKAAAAAREDSAHRQKAWVWKPGDPPPDPVGPCPCGSGRRYKKCCMPR